MKDNRKPIVDVSGPDAADSAFDSGNFVISDRYFHVTWESFDFPTDTILDQNLSTENELVSGMSRSNHSSGRFFISMQSYGNLVTCPVNTPAKPRIFTGHQGHINYAWFNLEGRGMLQIKDLSYIMFTLT